MVKIYAQAKNVISISDNILHPFCMMEWLGGTSRSIYVDILYLHCFMSCGFLYLLIIQFMSPPS